MLYVRSGHCMRTQRSCQVTRETPDPDTAWSLRHGGCVSLTQHLCDAECGGQTTGVTPGLSSPSRESNTNMDCQNNVSSPDCDYPDCVWLFHDVTSCLCFVLTLPGLVLLVLVAALGAGACLPWLWPGSVGVWSLSSAAVSHIIPRHPVHISPQSVIQSQWKPHDLV